MLNSKHSSDLLVRVPVADVIRRPVRNRPWGGGGFFDIVRPPGGQIKSRLPALAVTMQ